MKWWLNLKLRFACLGLTFLLVGDSLPLCRATVLTNNIALGSFFGSGLYLIQVTQPGAGGLFALSIDTNQPGQYTIGYAGIAELYSVHSASAGLEFTPSYVLGNAPLLHNIDIEISPTPWWTGVLGTNTPRSFQLSLGLGQSVLLAYWDDLYGFPNPSAYGIPDVYDGYGWFRLTRTASGLKVTDSATAVGGGIIVGTYIQVPEPSCLVLFGIITVSLFVRRK